jgi:ubiquinone/menaquinone biosynthesis C-methylase UbiE
MATSWNLSDRWRIVSGISKRQLKAPDFAKARYNKAMRKIWPWPIVLLEEIAASLNDLPGGLWLDAGCGEGQLADLIGKHRQLLGLDLDSTRLIRAKTHPYLSVVQGSVTSLPLEQESLSGIICIETLEHILDMKMVLKEFYRCLRPGGYLLISMPSVTLRSLWQMNRAKRPVYCSLQEHIRELSSVPISGFPNRFRTWEWLERGMSESGFKKIRQGGVGYLFPMWNGKLTWLEHIMNLVYRERINKLIGKLPVVRNYPYYCFYLFRRKIINIS